MMDRENARIAIRMEMLRSPALKWINFEFWVEHMSDLFVTLNGNSEPPKADLRCPNCGASASLPLGMTCNNHRPLPRGNGDSEPPKPDFTVEQLRIFNLTVEQLRWASSTVLGSEPPEAHDGCGPSS